MTLPSLTATLISLLILAAALLYSSVGQAGASGYLAIMALFGLPPEVMRATALVLNVLVASIATFRFARAGAFSWPLFWPFAATSIPFAFIGGSLGLAGSAYKIVVGVILLFAAARLYLGPHQPDSPPKPPRHLLALACGAAIGLVSGLTGVGGGIFLSPLLLFLGWAETRIVSGVSAAFILVNSIAALVADPSAVAFLPPQFPAWAAAAVLGGSSDHITAAPGSPT
jgi:uncharacterized membrane protein YfcA